MITTTMDCRLLPIRILYTINSDPQYILARSITNQPINLSQSHPYASCQLKLCLDAICRSSPELVQDSTRDFSVYVLDPLESLSSLPSSSSSQTQQPRGVAVGLGLMSWALRADDSGCVSVTGTIMKMGNGDEALEIIFALRETSYMQKASLSPLKSWGLAPAVATSKRPQNSSHSHPTSSTTRKVSTSHPHVQSVGWKSNSAGSKSKDNDCGKGKGKSKATSSSTFAPGSISASDSVLGASVSSWSKADRFEALVKNLKMAHSEAVKSSSVASAGPSTSDPESSKLTSATQRVDASTPIQSVNSSPAPRFARSADFPLSNSVVWCGPTPRQKVGRPKTKPFTNEPLGRRRPEHVPVPIPRSGGSLDPQPSVKVAGSETQTQTQMTLESLLAVLSSAAAVDRGTNDALLTALGTIDSSTSETGSTVNVGLVNALKDLLSAACNTSNSPAAPPQPAVAATPANANHQRTRSGSDTDEIILLDKENVNPGAFKRRSEKDASLSNARTNAVGEREKQRTGLGARNGNGVGAGRKRTLSDFMEEKEREKERQRERERARRESGVGRKRAGTGSSSLLSSSSAGNQNQTNAYSDMDYPFSNHASGFSHIVASLRPQTSPPRPASVHPFQRTVSSYTTASTSPIRPAPAPLPPNPLRKYVVPAWARTNTTTQPRLSEEALAQKAAAEADAEAERKRKKRAGRRAARAENDADNNGIKKKSAPVKRSQLVTSSNAGLKVAASLSLPVCASDVPVVSPSSPSPVSDNEGLAYSSQDAPKTPPPRSRRRHTFTPLTKSIGASGGSGLFTPTPRKLSGLFGINSPLFSPSVSAKNNSKGTKISPTRSVTTGKGWDVDKEEADEDEEERLSRELDDALEELDVPPSSLPIASSDFDTDPPPTSSSTGNVDSEANSQEDQTMPYWTTGLPPSSPPPPSSPILQAQTDDEDMGDFINDMSDSDGPIFEPEPEQNQQQFSEPLSDLNNSDFPFTDDLAMCFDDFNQLFSDPTTGTINPQDHDITLPSSDPVAQNGIADFDFSQFWESVKPLVDHQSMPDGLVRDEVQEMGEIDHVKLAEEVHALFSGCLM